MGSGTDWAGQSPEMANTADQTELPRRHGKAVPKPPARIAVKVIHCQGQAALVEYADAGRPARVTIPADLVADDLTVALADLAEGVPYGLPWEKAAVGKLTPGCLADALRNAGIWTGEDLRTKPRAALGALQAAYGIDLAALNRFTEESHG